MNKVLQSVKKAAIAATTAVATLPALVFAQYGENLNLGPGFATNRDLIGFVISVINVILGFLALIVFLIVLAAGFSWMTSGGDPKKIEAAQSRIKAAVIGLVVIFFSWAIVTFVFGVLRNV